MRLPIQHNLLNFVEIVISFLVVQTSIYCLSRGAAVRFLLFLGVELLGECVAVAEVLVPRNEEGKD